MLGFLGNRVRWPLCRMVANTVDTVRSLDLLDIVQSTVQCVCVIQCYGSCCIGAGYVKRLFCSYHSQLVLEILSVTSTIDNIAWKKFTSTPAIVAMNPKWKWPARWLKTVSTRPWIHFVSLSLLTNSSYGVTIALNSSQNSVQRAFETTPVRRIIIHPHTSNYLAADARFVNCHSSFLNPPRASQIDIKRVSRHPTRLAMTIRKKTRLRFSILLQR